MEFDFHAQMNHFMNESKEKETSSLSIDTFAKKVKLLQIEDTEIDYYSELISYLNSFEEYQNIYYFSTLSSAFGPIGSIT